LDPIQQSAANAMYTQNSHRKGVVNSPRPITTLMTTAVYQIVIRTFMGLNTHNRPISLDMII
jgi:hypothetical protein